MITSKARENAASAYTTNSLSIPSSPEKSLIKGPHHKRMQSLKDGNVRDLSSSLERRSPEKALNSKTPRLSEYREEKSRYPERSPTRDREETPTPTGRETPTRRSLKPILGENTPPQSATMLALQSMRDRDPPLTNITNSASALMRSPPNADQLSVDVLKLTNIATQLKSELEGLSRRSKDNAVDLIQLKEATNARDEDIRKSLKDLIANLSSKVHDPPQTDASHSAPNLRSLLLDNKAHTTPNNRKNFSLPRIPSPTSFSAALDRDVTASPSIVSSDGAASIALLEKVLREMGTKEGQEKIITTLAEVKSQMPKNSHDPNLTKKLDEVLKFLKEGSASQALVRAAGSSLSRADSRRHSIDVGNPKSGMLARAGHDVVPTVDSQKTDASQPAEFVNDEMMKILKRVKNSVAEGGGLTNEVKALVRELRGEVLGMGREIARRMEQAEQARDASTENAARGPDKEEISQIVEGGLIQLKDHMERVVRENRRLSSGTTKSAVDPEEMYMAVKAALAEYPVQREENNQPPGLQKEEILVAVREAWEECKPEIELQNFGLERDEILECLKEGLRAYQPQLPDVREVGASYDEVLEAVNKGLQNFRPPPIESEEKLTREEILMTVRDCLENVEFPTPEMRDLPPREPDITRDDVLDAVREGLMAQAPITKEVEFNRDDLFDAIKAGLEGAPTPMGGVGEQVLERMHALIEDIKEEFQQYSAANGKDTEQVLDALQDGLEKLRGSVESYVDRAADVTGKDEIIDTVKEGFQVVQDQIEQSAKRRSSGSVDTPELVEAMEKEFEHFRKSISQSLVGNGDSMGKAEILDAIREIQDTLGSHRGSSIDRDEILDAIRDLHDAGPNDRSIISDTQSNVAAMVKDELEHLRETIATTLIRGAAGRDEVLDAVREAIETSRDPPKSSSESILSNTSELLDAFQEGVDHIRADMQKLVDRPADLGVSDEILDTLKDGIANVRIDIEKLFSVQREMGDAGTVRGREVVVADEQTNTIQKEIEGLKVLVTRLQIKIDTLDEIHPAPAFHAPAENMATKEDVAELTAALREVQDNVADGFAAHKNTASENSATKEDTEAIETLLFNARDKIDKLSEGTAKQEDVDTVKLLLEEIKETVEGSTADILHKEDFSVFELILKEVSAGVEEIQSKVNASNDEAEEKANRVTKDDIRAIETLCLDTKTQIEEMVLPDIETLPVKADLSAIQDTIKGFQEQIEAENELTAQAFEARKTEHGGLATKIDDVQTLLGDLRDELKSKLDGSEEGLVELGRVLAEHHDNMNAYATAESVKDLVELVTKGFDGHLEKHDAAKLEVEERDAALSVKHDETRVAIAKEVSDRIDDRFNELMTKFDDAQLAADAKIGSLEDSKGEHLEAMTGTKLVVAELKSVMDSLGSTITETCDRMSDDAKTVFIRVDEIPARLEEIEEKAMTQHSITREDVGKTIAGIERVESSLGAHQPAIFEAVKEILAMVGQHYEHSQKSTEEIKTGMNGIPSAIPPLLPALPNPPPTPPPVQDVPAQKEYDDSQVHDKLNALLNHATIARENLGNMSKLDDIHMKVAETAQEVSSMVATQSRLMAEFHENRAQEAQQAAIALEKRTAQKEAVEAEIVSLTREKNTLVATVETLKHEKEELLDQSRRLSREAAGLETAVKLRTEEMGEMERRAEVLEKRILEGVMDHARSVMLATKTKVNTNGPVKRKRDAAAAAAAEKERDRAMSLKRVPSAASAASASTVKTDKTAKGTASNSTPNPTVLSSAMSMAMRRRDPNGLSSARSSMAGSIKGRRILSTSHVQGNSRRNVLGDVEQKMMVLAPNPSPGLVGLKRSQSVKSNPSSYYGGRKASWGGRDSLASEDKENETAEILNEEDEDEQMMDGGSDSPTERRTSYTGTVEGSDLYTDSFTYGTGSSFSTSTGTRSVSYTSSTHGTIEGERGGEDEDDDEDIDEEDRDDDAVAENAGDQTLPSETDNDQHESNVEEDQQNEADKIMALLGPPSASTDVYDFALSSPTAQPSSPAAAKISQPITEQQDSEKQLVTTNAATEQLNNQSFSDLGLEAPPKLNEVVLYGQHSDSGLGTDIPTAALEGVDGSGGYFGDQRDQDMGL